MVSPTAASPRVGIAPAYARTSRHARRPQCPFNVITRPFQIQPVMMHPVLPGETLKSLLIQSQVWSDPLAVATKSLGWWCEYNVFYVKHRDLPGWEIATDGLGKDLIDMMVSNESQSSYAEAADVPWTYCPKGGIDFLKNCMQRIVEEYFRDEGEAWNNATLDSVPLCQIYGRGRADAFERLTMASAYADRRVKLDVDNSGTIYVGDEIERAWIEWAAMRDAGVIDMDYNDWMRAYGAADIPSAIPDRVDFHRPEDIAYFRQYTYPTNTVEPSTGVPAVAVGWRVASRLDKQVRFEEPGWIVVTNTIRPKVYLKNQQGMVAAMMATRDSWLPPQRNDEWTVSHLLVDDAVGPLAAIMDAGNVDYWLDLRDLLNNGEQFINYAPTGAGFMALPSTTGARRYASSTEIDALFANSATAKNFRQDGMVSLNILGRQQTKGRNLVLGQA